MNSAELSIRQGTQRLSRTTVPESLPLSKSRARNPIGRKTTDRLVSVVSMAVLTATLGIMVWIVGTVFQYGWTSISWTFLTESSKPYGVMNGGIGNAALGTLIITGIATLIAVPPAIAGGIYLAEFGRKSRIADGIRFCANVMMGIPSIVVGLFVYAALVVPMGGFSGLAGSVALAIIMFPVIMRTTEDMLLMIPDALREAALAIGMTRRQATLNILCRAARGGLTTGVLMAFARVSGETAPLLFTALWSDAWPTGYCSGPTANLPVLITEYTANSPFDSMHAVGWGAALVVMAFMLAINITVRMYMRKKSY